MTAATATAPGVLLDRPDVRILDSSALPWEDNPGVPGGLIKPLVRDAAGEPSVYLVWYPPGFSRGQRVRHVGVREFVLVLAGEVWLREYAAPEDTEGELVVYRQGYFLDRAPGALHGIMAETSPVGCTLLEWKLRGSLTGVRRVLDGTTIVPVDGAPERVKGRASGAPATAASDGVVFQRGGTTLLDMRAMAWHAHPSATGVVTKALSWDEEGDPTVVLAAFPPGAPTDTYRARHDCRELTFVLDGDRPTSEWASADAPAETVVLDAGGFVDRAPGSLHGYGTVASRRGSVILTWRTHDGEFLGHHAAAAATEHVPVG